MIGLVLAAGASRRLRPDTDHLPKTLLPVDGEATILDIALRNLAAVGLTDVVVIVGYAAAGGRRPGACPGAAARRGDSNSSTTTGPRSGTTPTRCGWRASISAAACCWSTATLCIRSASSRRCWPPAKPDTGADLILALDNVKQLADEEMKVVLDGRGLMTRITKQMDPADADGEYIGATLIEPGAADALADASRPPGSGTLACTTRTATRS